ncbi:DDE_3 domain-containing protein [Trichonephila clavipes]|nr:DDE_3 domain-containing protein [Trichonephila clavipes]
MKGHIYRDVILEQHVRLYRAAMGAEFLFMDDNASPHHANIVDECLQSENVTRMDWPAYSPNLNPIEHVWDMLGRRIAARQPPPSCLPELRRALLDEWCNIPQDQIDNLVLSMPRTVLHRPGDILRINHHTNHVILFFVNKFFFEIFSRNSVRDSDEEESNDEEYNSKYDSFTEIDPDLEEGDTVKTAKMTSETSELEILQMKASQITDESLESTRRMLQLAEEVSILKKYCHLYKF